MKKINTIGILTFALSSAVNAQEKKVERMKLYKVEKTQQSSTTEEPAQKFASPEEEIVWCENHINALDSKEEWIRGNAEETKIANENGWFE